MKKNVLIVRSNPVDPDSRVEKEAHSLSKNGFNVTLLVWDRTTNRSADDYKTIQDVNVKRIRIGAKATYGEGLKNILPYLKFQWKVFNYIIKHSEQYDIVHSCDFDTANTSQIACKIKKIPMVFDIFDYLDARRGSLLSIIVDWRQKRIINTSAATIICTEKRKAQIKGSKPKKIAVIHNSPANHVIGNSVLKGTLNRVKIVYVGILQEGRLILELLDLVKKSDYLELHIAGFGYLEDKIVQVEKESTNIFYYGRISYESTLALEQKCDIITAIYDPAVKNHYYAAPNKFYEGLFLGKPLIMVKNTGMSEIVEKEKIGVLIEYSEQGLREGIDKICRMNEEWAQMSCRMKEIYNSCYSWEIMEQRLIQLYQEI